MNEFNSFFAQAYWWLSLFGGLHCLALASYIRFFYRTTDNSSHILASFLALIALYFLTGMLNKDNSPIPLHILFNLLNPLYFLLMPLLYLYCKRCLQPTNEPLGLSKHYWPAIVTALFAMLDFSMRVQLHQSSGVKIDLFDNNFNISQWEILLPALLSLQTCFYFGALWSLFQQQQQFHTGLATEAHIKLTEIRLSWLVGLTGAMLLNWLTRVLVVIFPFYFGDHLSLLSHALPRLTLLLSMYLLAVYGLQHITRSAYLSGRLTAQAPTATTSNESLLTDEEYAFLQEIQQDSQVVDEPKKNTKTKN